MAATEFRVRVVENGLVLYEDDPAMSHAYGRMWIARDQEELARICEEVIWAPRRAAAAKS